VSQLNRDAKRGYRDLVNDEINFFFAGSCKTHVGAVNREKGGAARDVTNDRE